MPQTKGENETAQFVCQGEGLPRPDLPRWFINGVPLRGILLQRCDGSSIGASSNYSSLTLLDLLIVNHSPWWSIWHCSLCSLSSWHLLASPCSLSSWLLIASLCSLSAWHLTATPCHGHSQFYFCVGSDGNRIIGDEYGPSTTLTITNLQKERDTMAIQCNITNYLIGSWVHSSFYLNVQCECQASLYSL